MVVVYEDLEAEVLGDGIYFLLQHSDPGVKATWRITLSLLYVNSSGSIIQLPSRRRLELAFIMILRCIRETVKSDRWLIS